MYTSIKSSKGGEEVEHVKTHYSRTIDHPRGNLVVEGPLSPTELRQLSFHDELTAFRPPKEQFEALVEIAELPEGRILVARDKNLIVGYVTFVYPDPLERWSEANLDNLIELGAIEVAPSYRSGGIGRHLLEVSMLDDAMEDYIVITTEYYWHWDLKRTGLSVWDYRKIMERMMNYGGLEYFSTDDPEICSHPANCLMARIGSRVDQHSIETFDHLRLSNRYMY